MLHSQNTGSPAAPSSSPPRRFGDSLVVIAEYPHLRALRQGATAVTPLLFAAAIATVVNNFPLDLFQTFMVQTFGSLWKKPGALLLACTIDILSLAIAYTLSASLVTLHNERFPKQSVAPSVGPLVCFSALFLISRSFPDVGKMFSGIIWPGPMGLPCTVLITCASAAVFLRLCRVPALRSRYSSESSDPLLPEFFDALAPAVITLLLFVGIRYALAYVGINDTHLAFSRALRSFMPNGEGNFSFGLLYTLLTQCGAFLGITGSDFLASTAHSVLAGNLEADIVALNNGLDVPHALTRHFFTVFVHLGGAGGTLGLIAAMLLRAKDAGAKRIAALALIPGLFNVNPLLLFGLPVVFNPIFLIPFITVPVILYCVAYAAVIWHIVPAPVYDTAAAIPPLIGGWSATGSWHGAALQCVQLIIAAAVYLPFVDMLDSVRVHSRKKVFLSLKHSIFAVRQFGELKNHFEQPGSAGALARSLAGDLLRSLDDDDHRLTLNYQPRVNLVQKTVPCVEALLRWEHPDYGLIPTPLALAVAQHAELTNRLDALIVKKAILQQYHWRLRGLSVIVSINLSENQLRDKTFPETVRTLLFQHGLSPEYLSFEVPEILAFDRDGTHIPALRALRDIGVHICVDDFCHGYQSLSYLKRLPLSELQIDRALIQDIASDKNCQNVLASVQELCLSLGIKTTAEFVESREQLETLLELNFSSFQGHLFSASLPPDQCAEFIRGFTQNGTAHLPARPEALPQNSR